MHRRFATLLLLAIVSSWRLAALPAAPLPNVPGSLKFAVLGDNGSGDQGQYDIAEQMRIVHQSFAYEFVIMLGDNFYGAQKPPDLIKKFDRPYKPLTDAGVTFHAAIGNHDEPATIHYSPLNMNGQRYYTFVRKNARFFVLDTNMLDKPQLQWFEAALAQSSDEWKIAYFHHPLYGNAGRHGSNVDTRVLVEPLLLRYGVSVVFSGHDHVYERLKPQRGIHYFVAGSGGKLRKGDLEPSATTAAGFDSDQAFMVVEIQGDDLHFQTIARTGATVDTGVIPRMATRIGT